MNLKGTNNEKIEYEVDKDYLDRIKKYAEEHNFVINEFSKKKIEWMRTHSAHCFCDPLSDRICPCDHVYEDMKQYNGRCLCRLFWKPKAYAKWKKQRQKQKPLTKFQEYSMNDVEKAEAKKQIKEVWEKLEK